MRIVVGIIIFIGIGFSGNISAQNDFKANKEIIGNSDWYMVAYSVNDSVEKNSADFFFSFNDSLYYWVVARPGLLDRVKDTISPPFGKWFVTKENVLMLYEHSSFQYWSQHPLKIYQYRILYCAGDSLMVSPIDQSFVKMTLKKVPDLKFKKPKIEYFNPDGTITNINYFHKDKAKLKAENKLNQKKITLNVGASITLRTYKYNSYYMSYRGTMFTCDSNAVYFKLGSKHYSNFGPDGVNTFTQTYYPDDLDTIIYPWLNQYRIERIPYNSINTIEYEGKGKYITESLGIICLTALGSMLVLAPAISYNYKTGNFNQKRYFKIMVPSLITFGVSIPLAILIERKEPREIDNSKYEWIFTPDKN